MVKMQTQKIDKIKTSSLADGAAGDKIGDFMHSQDIDMRWSVPNATDLETIELKRPGSEVKLPEEVQAIEEASDESSQVFQ